MEEKKNTIKDEDLANSKSEGVSFLKVDALTRGSYGLSLFLKTNDIIVGVDKKIFRGTQKSLNDILKENEKTVITIHRKNSFLNILAAGPLGLKLKETSPDEDTEILDKVRDYLDNISSFDNYKEYEIFRGRANLYNIIEVNEGSIFATLFPLIWFFHNKLYFPLFLIIILFILLGAIDWWLFFASWIILTIYMSKGSMSLLRGYCMFNEMRMHSKIFGESYRSIQLTIRELDKKSNFVFAEIPLPETDEEKKEENKEQKNLSPQTS